MTMPSEVDVVIVGGGPVGLSCSILLSLLNIQHVLFERHASTSIHPKAAGINQRTTEIFRVMGIEDEVYQHAASPNIAGRTAWYTSLGENGRELYSRDAWGGGKYAEEYATFSPSKYCILPQIRLEPILRDRAVALNDTGIFYNTEVLKCDNVADGAQVVVENRLNQQRRVITARYVIVADGGRMFTEKLNVKWLGEGNLFDMVTAHFRAPLGSLHPDPLNFMTWFSNPTMGGSTRTGYLYQIGPWPLTEPSKEEWVFACGKSDGDPDEYNQASMVKRLRQTIGIPDLQIEMLSFSHWKVNAIYAERWRIGNIFLVGDAAHRIPPWGALGMNTGIQDAYNLVWKIGFALQDPVRYDGLLSSYETERLDIGRRVGQTSLLNMRRHGDLIDAAVGMSINKTREENEAEVAAFFDLLHPQYASKRAALEVAAQQLDTEFKAPGYEVGWFYPSVDVRMEGGATHGGQQTPGGHLVFDRYFPSTIPGHHVPHGWIEVNGCTRAYRDLLSLDKLTLFVKQPVEIADHRVKVVSVKSSYGVDKTGLWTAMTQSDGLLVRPDGIVAWRGCVSDWRKQVDSVLACRTRECVEADETT